MKQGYFTRLIPFTEIKELQTLLPKIDALGLTNDVVKKQGAITLTKFQSMSQTQHIDLYKQIKDALVTIKAKDTK